MYVQKLIIIFATSLAIHDRIWHSLSIELLDINHDANQTIHAIFLCFIVFICL